MPAIHRFVRNMTGLDATEAAVDPDLVRPPPPLLAAAAAGRLVLLPLASIGRLPLLLLDRL